MFKNHVVKSLARQISSVIEFQLGGLAFFTFVKVIWYWFH